MPLMREGSGNEVFISYSRQDRRWLVKLRTVLQPLLRNRTLELWDDSRIDAGTKWKAEIEAALARANLAVLLVSDSFLASEFIASHELPRLLRMASEQGLRIFWILVSSCMYQETEIAEYQAAYDPSRPLDSLRAPEAKKALVSLAQSIQRSIQEENTNRPSAQRPEGASETRIEAQRTPQRVRGNRKLEETGPAATTVEIMNARELAASPIRTNRRQGIIALGHMDSLEATEALAHTLDCPYPDTRLFAAIELAKKNDTRAKPELAQALLRPEPGAMYGYVTKEHVFAALGSFGPDAIPEIGLLVNAPLTEVRARAVLTLGRLGGPQAARFLRAALKDRNPLVRGHAVDALGEIQAADPAVVRDLIALLSDRTEITHNPELQHFLPFMSDSACVALDKLNGPEARRAVEKYKRLNASRFLELKEKRRSERNFSKLDLILTAAKHKLGSDESLQHTLSALRKEQDHDLGENQAAEMSGPEMRKLPSFLEDIWTELHDSLPRGRLDLSMVYRELGEFVLLCDGSELLWRDEKTPKSKRFWSRFRKLAAAMKRERIMLLG